MAHSLYGKDMFYEAAKEAHASVFEHICSKREEIESRQIIENLYRPGTMVNIDAYTSYYRIHLMRDFTCYANYYQDAESPMFQFGDDGFQLFYERQNNEPLQVKYSRLARMDDDDPSAVSKFWTCDDIINLDLFGQIELKTIARLVRESRQTGIPITAANALEAVGIPIDEAKDKMRRQAQTYASDLNHISLLWDFEIARHLQMPTDLISQQHSELPMGIGVAIVLELCSPYLTSTKDKKMIRGIFTGHPLQRARNLKQLIGDYIHQILLKRNPRLNFKNKTELKMVFVNLLRNEYQNLDPLKLS